MIGLRVQYRERGTWGVGNKVHMQVMYCLQNGDHIVCVLLPVLERVTLWPVTLNAIEYDNGLIVPFGKGMCKGLMS